MQLTLLLTLLTVFGAAFGASFYTLTIEGQLSNVAVETYNFGASAPFDSTSQIPFGGGSRGKAAFNTMTITRKSDTFSPLLYKAMFSNTNFDVVLKESLPDPSGKPEFGFKFSLNDARLIEISNNGTGTSSTLETLRFGINKVSIEYKDAKRTTSVFL